jgi:aminoglycoside phosphotransferase (APT) family kinase protein
MGFGRDHGMTSAVVPADAASDVAELLKRFLIRELDGACSIEICGLHRTSYGYSCENWPFDLRWTRVTGEEQCERLILRRDATDPLLESSRTTEFEVLRALQSYETLPTPRARWLDGTGTYFGRPATIMERCPGVCDPMVLSTGTSPKLGLARKLMDAVVAIHAFNWHAANLDRLFRVPSAGTSEAAMAALDHWQEGFRLAALASYPEFEFVLAWLRAHVPVSRYVTLVHGDFKPGNTLIADDEVVAVLDWETAHLGDPLEDLAWVTNPLRAREHQIPDVWENHTMISYYRSATGREIDQSSLRWWGVLANFKLLTISLTGMRGFLCGKADRPMGNPRQFLPFLLGPIEADGLN